MMGSELKYLRAKPLAWSLLGLAVFRRASMPWDATAPAGMADGRNLAAQGCVADQ